MFVIFHKKNKEKSVNKSLYFTLFQNHQRLLCLSTTSCSSHHMMLCSVDVWFPDNSLAQIKRLASWKADSRLTLPTLWVYPAAALCICSDKTALSTNEKSDFSVLTVEMAQGPVNIDPLVLVGWFFWMQDTFITSFVYAHIESSSIHRLHVLFRYFKPLEKNNQTLLIHVLERKSAIYVSNH